MKKLLPFLFLFTTGLLFSQDFELLGRWICKTEDIRLVTLSLPSIPAPDDYDVIDPDLLDDLDEIYWFRHFKQEGAVDYNFDTASDNQKYVIFEFSEDGTGSFDKMPLEYHNNGHDNEYSLTGDEFDFTGDGKIERTVLQHSMEEHPVIYLSHHSLRNYRSEMEITLLKFRVIKQVREDS